MLAFILTSLTFKPSLTIVDYTNKLKNAIVRIHDESNNFVCSGTMINNSTVLTAAHCIIAPMPLVGLFRYRILNYEGKPIFDGARVLAYNERTDIALLISNNTSQEKISIDINPTSILDKFEQNNLMICGFPYGGALLCKRFYDVGQYVMYRKGKGSIWPGMSGGPIIDLNTLTIIGTTQAINESYTIVNPTIELWRMLNINEIK